MKSTSPILLFTALFLAWNFPAEAATVTFREGESNTFAPNYAGTSDTTLASNVSQWNGGALEYFTIGRNFTRKSLLRFDLTSLAGNIGAIQTASLTLFPTGNATSADLAISVYQLARENAAWNEGTGQFLGTANPGEVTWSQLGYNTENWAGSVGAGTSGVDYLATPVASFLWTASDPSVTFALSPSLIQQWINTPSENGGLLFVPTNGAGVTSMTVNFASSAHTTQSLRPLLTLTYQSIPEPGTAILAATGLAILALRRRTSHR